MTFADLIPGFDKSDEPGVTKIIILPTNYSATMLSIMYFKNRRQRDRKN